MFAYTTAIHKIRMMDARKKVVQGGTSAGKTYAIIPILIDLCAKQANIKTTVVAESIPAVKDGAADIFKTVMQETGRWVDDHWLGNPMQYRFSNGARIQFKSFDTVGKAKAAGKRDVLFLNEGNHIAYPIADALMIRSKETFIDFNPDAEFWAHTEVLREPNSEFLRLTYEDNEALPPETLEDLLVKKEKAFFNARFQTEKELFQETNIKNKHWANWWRVYGMGLPGRLEGLIFQNWETIASIPPEASLVARGIDFGYTNDPTTIVELWKINGKHIWNESLYRTGLFNGDIAKILEQQGAKKNDYIYADSAEPKSIAEINRYGFHIKPAAKGKGSVTFGISLLQEEDFFVTESSINLIKELRNYKWDIDRNGNRLNCPIDAFNHCIDAMRYVAEEKISKRKISKSWGGSKII